MKTKRIIRNTMLLLCVLATAGCSKLLPWTEEMSWDEMRIERSADAPLKEPEPFVRVIQGKEIKELSADESQTPVAEAKSPLDEIRLETLYFNEVPMERAVMMLTRMTGLNIAASKAAMESSVSVYAKNISARGAIEGICRLNGLWYREDAEMVRILTAEEYSHELIIRHDEQTRLYYLKNASALAVADMIAALMPDQVEYVEPGEDASYGHVGTDGDDPMDNSSTGSGGSSRSSGVSRSSHKYSLSDVESKFEEGVTAGKLETLARGSSEGTKGEVGTSELAEKAGISAPASIAVFLRNNCIAVRASQESLQGEIGKIIESLDTPTREVLLEVKVMKVTLGDGFESFLSLSYHNGGMSLNTLPNASIEGGTISFSYLNSNITATLKLLQTENRLHMVATPMLLCANNAPAEFFSGITRMITTNYDFETRYGDDNEAVDIARPVVDEREIGTKVRIKPSINDNGTVTLRFLLEIASVNEQGGSIFQVQGDEVVELPIDTINNEKVESIVVATHGQAVVMGGLINESRLKNVEKVPILGDVPVLGLLFRKQIIRQSREETVIVIIPHIMQSADKGAATSKKVMENNSRQSIGPMEPDKE